MEDEDNESSENSERATVDQIGPPIKDDNGPISEGNDGQNHKDHQIAQVTKAGTILKRVTIHGSSEHPSLRE